MGIILTNLLLSASITFAGAVLLVALENLLGRPGRTGALPAFFLIVGAAFATKEAMGLEAPAIGLSIVNLLLVLPIVRQTRGISRAGIVLLSSNAEMVVAGLLWALWFIATINVGPVTRALMLAVYPLLAITSFTTVVQGIEQWEALIRVNWWRPRLPLRASSGAGAPFVSLHVPVYAEPPGVVIETLNSIAGLDYANYEVIVVDNNTRDETLWRPVEAHCRKLGPAFRFFHVDPLAGAKAGAVNFALRQTDPRAEVIGIVDSDYQVAQDFIDSLIGHFEDPRMGFVQTPHDYREWRGNSFLRKCYWEYRYFFETNLVSQNERDAAIIVGTMCLIRKSALEEAGGWAEWCATEDSELAIRIHALGYSSIYVNQTFGRGLIPETFAGFKKQRHRWTAGPVQEFKRHWRLFLPAPFGRESKLTPLQKLHHLNHGIENISMGLSFLTLLLGAAVVGSMTLFHEVVPVPFALWLTATVTVATNFVHWWLAYGVLCDASPRETLGAYVTSKALTYVRGVGSLHGLLKPNIAWHRTSKFKALPSGLSSLGPAQAETMLGLGSMVFGVAALVLVPHAGLLRMLGIGALIQSVFYLAAPALAVLAERELRPHERKVVSGSRRHLAMADADPASGQA